MLLLIAGTVIATLFGHESVDGDQHENLLGGILSLIGFLGLLAVGARAVFRRIRRIQNWWTGNG